MRNPSHKLPGPQQCQRPAQTRGTERHESKTRRRHTAHTLTRVDFIWPKNVGKGTAEKPRARWPGGNERRNRRSFPLAATARTGRRPPMRDIESIHGIKVTKRGRDFSQFPSGQHQLRSERFQIGRDTLAGTSFLPPPPPTTTSHRHARRRAGSVHSVSMGRILFLMERF